MNTAWEYAKEEESTVAMYVSSLNKEWSADVRFDGCVHLRRYYNSPGPHADQDYLHICDLDEFIAQMQELRELAKAHFDDWPQ